MKLFFSAHTGLFAALEAYRFLQGIAIGAEYPAGSVAASENTEHPSVTKNRQQMLFTLATVSFPPPPHSSTLLHTLTIHLLCFFLPRSVLAQNSMIDVGFVVANFVPLVLLWIFG